MIFTFENYLFAAIIVIFAGLSTVIGGIITILNKEKSSNFLPFALGLSAGVMLYVSFVEIFPKGTEYLVSSFGDKKGTLISTLAFFGGIGLIAIIDFLIPDDANPHPHPHEEEDSNSKKKSLLRIGLFTAVAITIHNFPEGLATFTAALTDPALGLSIAIAIALHNIPEGIVVAAPIYQATGSKGKAIKYSLLSGLSEPVGAILGFILLRNIFSDALFGSIFSIVAGIMIYISIDELLPTAEKHGKHHTVILGVILGMIIMALSLLLF